MSISLYLKFFYLLTLSLFCWNLDHMISFTDKHTYYSCSTHNNLSDTIRSIIPDDYPVTNKMLEKYFYIDGQQYSEEFVWFTNDTLKQTILFQLYTDYHRLSIFHFLNDNFPKDLIKPFSAAEIGCEKINRTCIDSNIKFADRINRKFFTSNKGIRLNKSKQEVMRHYGKADKIMKQADTEIYSWDFVGDFFSTDGMPKTNKTYAKNSFGYQVRMFFKNDKLIAMHLHNNIS
jgi:hypothetical protein